MSGLSSIRGYAKFPYRRAVVRVGRPKSNERLDATQVRLESHHPGQDKLPDGTYGNLAFIRKTGNAHQWKRELTQPATRQSQGTMNRGTSRRLCSTASAQSSQWIPNEDDRATSMSRRGHAGTQRKTIAPMMPPWLVMKCLQ